MSVPKPILIWLIVTKKWYAHQYRIFRIFRIFMIFIFALSTLFGPKNQHFWKKTKKTGDVINLHWCTKNQNHMISNSQNVWIALAIILGHLRLLPNFWPKKSNFWEKEKIPGYIIILHLHSKNYNHLMYSSLKIMPTALQVVLGQFLPFYSISGPKLKFSKNKKIPKTY